MINLTYEWKVDFAFIISAMAMIFSFAVWILDKRRTRKIERIRAYEEIYEDVCFILEFPGVLRNRKVKQILYTNEDPELQRAVRMYVDSHWMEQAWGKAKFIPSHVTDERQKLEFMRRVHDEVSKFSDKLHAEKFKLTLPELSPVFHLDEPEIDKKLKRIIERIGRRFSLFSEDVGRLWGLARISEPFDIRGEYEKALQACKNYFDHNPRGFDDPFYDLVKRIFEEYRLMTRTRKQKIEELILKLKLLLWRIRHPIRYYRMRKER